MSEFWANNKFCRPSSLFLFSQRFMNCYISYVRYPHFYSTDSVVLTVEISYNIYFYGIISIIIIIIIIIMMMIIIIIIIILTTAVNDG